MIKSPEKIQVQVRQETFHHSSVKQYLPLYLCVAIPLLLIKVIELLVLFTFGTEALFVAMQGSVWFVAHVVATTFLLLHLAEMLGKRRAWLAALYLGLASLSRSLTLFAFPCYMLYIFFQERKQPR